MMYKLRPFVNIKRLQMIYYTLASLHMNANRLALNVSKTNFVIFSASNKPLQPVTILINRQAIEQFA